MGVCFFRISYHAVLLGRPVACVGGPGIGTVPALAKVLCYKVPKEGVRLQQTGEHHY